MAAKALSARPLAPRDGPERGRAGRPKYAGAKRALTILFVVVVIGLVANYARHVEWHAVGDALRAYPAGTLLLAAGLAAASHVLYCGYDLIGRHQTGHRLPARTVAGVGFTCYVFNLNFGSLVGGVALRYRLYARLGLEAPVIAQIWVLSLLTNWLGYFCVAGCLFLFLPPLTPPGWELGREGLRWIGAALLVAAAAYLSACVVSKRRTWQVRGHAVRLPSGRIALLQLLLSAANWMTIAAIVWVLLQHRIDYASVLGVLLVAAVAGVVAHVPAGLGVIEAVFIALLSHRVPTSELLAALLAYRALYYLAPLALALGLFLRLDGSARSRTGRSAAGRSPIT